MEYFKSVFNNNFKNFIGQVAINSSTVVFNSRNIEELNDDCIVYVLSFISNVKDLVNCKCINKRFLNIIDSNEILEKLYFSKNYVYMLPINKQLLAHQEKNSILKARLLCDIKKKASILLQAKQLNLQKIAIIEYKSIINKITFNTSNNFFATIANHDTVKFYQFTDNIWKPLCEKKYESLIVDIVFIPDSNGVIIFFEYGYIIREIVAKNYLQIDNISNADGYEVYFRADSKRLFIKSKNNPIQIFDYVENNWLCILSINDNELSEFFDISVDGFNDEKLCNFFNLSEQKFIDVSSIVKSIKNDNWLKFIIKRYAISCMFKELNLYDMDLSREILRNAFNRSYLDSEDMLNNFIVYSIDMKLIYIQGSNNKNKILHYTNDIKSNAPNWVVKYRFISKDNIDYACFSQNNKHLMEKNLSDKLVNIWGISGGLRKELILHDNLISKFSEDGDHLVTVSSNNQLVVWCFIDNAWRVRISQQCDYSIQDVFFNSYNRRLFIVASHTDRADPEIYNIIINKVKVISPILKNIKNDCFFATFCNTVYFWHVTGDNFSKGKTLTHRDKVASIVFTPDNSHIILASDVRTTIWKREWSQAIKDCNYIEKITIETGKNTYISVRDDSRKILLAAKNTPIRVFTLENDTWQQDLVINHITEAFEIKQGIFIPLLKQIVDDDWLNQTLQIYSFSQIKIKNSAINTNGIINTEAVEKINNFSDQIKDIVFSIINNSIVYTFNKNKIFYSQNNKLMLLAFGFNYDRCFILEYKNNQYHKKLELNHPITNVYFSLDNKRIITCYKECAYPLGSIVVNSMMVWNIATDIAYQELGLKNIDSASFSLDDKYLATSSDQGRTVKIWEWIDDRWKVKASA